MTTKSKSVGYIPESYHAVAPYIVVKGVAHLLDFVKAAFAAKEIMRVPNPDGTIGHAEVRIGDSEVMMFDAKENWPLTPSFLRLYVADSDATYAQALKAGATSVTEMVDGFTGDRGGRVCDPLGNIWWIQTHVEDVTPEQMAKRAAEKKYIDSMQVAQETFDREMSSRSRK